MLFAVLGCGGMIMKKAIYLFLALTVILSAAAIEPLSAGAAEVDTENVEVNVTENVENADRIEDNALSANGSADDSVGAGYVSEPAAANKPEIANADAIAKPAAPSLSLANVSAGLKASWNAVLNAESYAVYYRTGADQAWSSFQTSETSAVIPEAISGTLYFVKVQSIGAGGSGGDHSKVKSMTCIDRAVINSVNYNGRSVSLGWNRVGGANKYQIARLKSGESYYTYFTTASASFTDNGVVAGNKYYYQVRAMYATADNGTAYGAWSVTNSAVTLAKPDVTLSNKSNGIRAQWKAVNGAAKYIVYYKPLTASKWSSVTTTDTYYPYLKLSSGRQYAIQVRPITNTLNGPYSKAMILTYLSRPEVKLSDADNGFDVNWKAIGGANGYEIAKLKKGASAYTYFSVADNSFVDNDIKGNTEYYYQVRAVYADESGEKTYSAWSVTQAVIKITPPDVELSNKSNGIRAQWNAVMGATGYIVYYRAASDSDWSSATTANTYYPILDVKSGTEYCVRVRAVFGSTNGTYSKTKNLVFLGKVSVQMSMTGENLKLGWKGIDGATQYEIARLERGKTEFKYFTAERTFFVDKEAASSKKFYSYQIRAVYKGENSNTSYGGWSDVYSFADGKILNGYYTYNGNKYYYKNGVLQKNRIVGTKSEGYYSADSSGVCCVSEEMRLAAEFIMNCGTGDTLDQRMKTCFKYLTDHFPYSRSYDHPTSSKNISALAIDMFKNKKGNCFRYAACFTCVARLCGYRARIGVGCTGNGSPHGWSEVYIGGKWYYFDPDMQLPGYGFPDYYAYKMSYHPWNVRATFKSEVTINNGKAVWN